MTGRRLGELIDGHAAALQLFARSWCAAPEDVVQEAFCKLAAEQTWPDDPVAWLYRVVRNRAIDAGRSARRRVKREALAARPVRWFEETNLDGLDAVQAVAALERLSVEHREIITARLWGGRTLEECARLAGCSVTTAHRRYEAGLALLREMLGAPCKKT